MIVPRLASGGRRLASGVLIFCGTLTHAKAQPVMHPAVRATRAETAASDAVKEGAESGSVVVRQQGVASWYGRAWRGRRTASGTRFDDRSMTAAHLWLPFATLARVTNLQTGRSVDVVVTDRGPYRPGRIIDLSAKAAEALGIKECGIAEVIVSAQY
jgi:rare lipoprotein A